jgi:hypothetical protein
MPTPMTDDERDEALKTAVEVDTFEFRNEDDDEDFILAELRKDVLGHFRLVTMSGMHSIFNGGTLAERLTEDEVRTWTDF